ncbi:MAG: AAA family ATPase, partial [Candidatus Acidoferrales bacterium]
HVEDYARIVKQKALLRKLADFGDRICQQAFDARQDPMEVLAQASHELQILSAHYRDGQWAETNLRFRTAAEIAAEAPGGTDWIARPWVAAGSMVELSGKPKLSGKTTWLLGLARAVLDGLPFLGQPTARSPVMFLTEEQPGTFRVALEKAGLLGRAELVVLHHNDTLGRAWEDVVHTVMAESRRRGARLLILDTVATFVGLEGDAENNAGDALVAMRPLQKAAGAGLGVVVSRHERKSGGALGDSGRGSSAYAGVVDTLLALRRPERNSRANLRVIHGISRFDGVPDELVVELTPDGYVARGSPTDIAAEEAVEVILAAAPLSKEEALDLDSLLQGTPVARSTAQRVLKGLVAAGRLLRTGKGCKGDSFRYFRPEFVSAHCPSLDGQNESEAIRAGLEAGRRAGFSGDPVKKPDKPDGSREVEV